MDNIAEGLFLGVITPACACDWVSEKGSTEDLVRLCLFTIESRLDVRDVSTLLSRIREPLAIEALPPKEE